jgi:hypothetical protein
MQPLFISNTSSSAPITSASSTPTAPNSFSMTANRRPCCSVRMRLSKVVLPDPRKPVSTVTDTRWSESMCSVAVKGVSNSAVGEQADYDVVIDLGKGPVQSPALWRDGEHGDDGLDGRAARFAAGQLPKRDSDVLG